MEPINTDLYRLERKETNEVVRIDGLGNETPEMTSDYYTSQIAFHTQVIANLEAQAAKLAEFEADNPPVELPEAKYDI